MALQGKNNCIDLLDICKYQKYYVDKAIFTH